MKKFKKTAILCLALGMAGALGLTACGGGKGDGGVKGEILADESAWVQALTDTAAATNATISGTVKGEGRMGEFYYKQSGTILSKVASGRVYALLDFTYDSNMEEMFAPQQKAEYYHGVVDGVVQEWNKEGDGEWEQQDHAPEEFTGTIGFALMQFAELPLEYLYNAYLNFENVGDTYVWEVSGESGSQTVEFKFSDGKLYSYAIKVLSTGEEEGEAYTTSSEMTLTITYGNTSVGALPGQEEEPETPDGSDGGDSSEDVGENYAPPEFDFDNTYGADIIGEEVSSDELASAIAAACASTNFTIKGHSFIQGGASLVTVNAANEKTYNVTRATYPTSEGGVETTELHAIVGEVDGVAYAWMSFDDGATWDCAPAEEVVVGSGYKNGEEVFGMYLQAFGLVEPTFVAATGEYVVEMGNTTISVKIVDGTVKTLSMDMGDGQYVAYVIEYGNAVDFKLPPVDLGGGKDPDAPGIPEVVVPVGEEVNAENWAAAIAEMMAATNFSVDVEMGAYLKDGSEKQVLKAYMDMQIANNKGYYVQITQREGVTNTSYSYIGTVNGTTYAWSSSDGKTWDCRKMSYKEVNGAWFMGEMLPTDMTFDNVTFDEEVGGYKYVGDDETLIIGFKDGRVAFLIDEYTTYSPYGDCLERDVWVITYGDATVGELPPVEDAGDNNNTIVGGGTTDEGGNTAGDKIDVMG